VRHEQGPVAQLHRKKKHALWGCKYGGEGNKTRTRNGGRGRGGGGGVGLQHRRPAIENCMLGKEGSFRRLQDWGPRNVLKKCPDGPQKAVHFQWDFRTCIGNDGTALKPGANIHL